MKSKIQEVFLAINTFMLWSALILQFIISTTAYRVQGLTFIGAIVKILSFYTIETNLLIAVAMTAILLFPRSGLGRFFSKTRTLTAIAVYILIVGLVYAIALKGIWQPTGLFKLADVLLHEVSPVTFILFWLFFVEKEKLPWLAMTPWAVFPLAYLAFTLCRGAFTGDYPYPFINAAKLGYLRVTINSMMVLLVFLVLGSLFIGISRQLSIKRS